tara:strand:+ start:373 stop:618 length:246 start_codon:yes stop_codon:yes gene_type:complete
MDSQYENGYESAKTTMVVLGKENLVAISKYYDGVLAKRNSQEISNFDSLDEYNKYMDWLDGSLDYIEQFLCDFGESETISI